jgi:hypothetical protein
MDCAWSGRLRRLLGGVALVVVCVSGVACADSGYVPTAEDAERCGALGSPVTAAKLVEVFRANGVTLDVNQWKCEQSGFVDGEATNAGPKGFNSDNDVKRREGHVLCHTWFEYSRGPRVQIVKYPTDTETHFSVLNVDCAVYPSDAASERRQVRRVADALRAVLRAVPDTPEAELCGSRGAPVTVADVDDVLRHSGFAMMRVSQAKCERPASDLPDVTNLRPYAQEYDGIVSCWVGTQKDPFEDLELGEERKPTITVRSLGDTTSMTVLNVRCTIDPLEQDAPGQIARLREAMELL